MTTLSRTLSSDDPLAIELTAALKQGDVQRLSSLLASQPDLSIKMSANSLQRISEFSSEEWSAGIARALDTIGAVRA